MTETKTAAKIYKELETKHGCFVFNIAGSIFQRNGMPDCLVVKDTMYFWIECKMEDKPVEPLQLSIHRKLAKQGVHVFILRFIDDNFWLVDDFYTIRFKKFSEGVSILWSTLQELQSKKGVNIVPMVTSSIKY